MHGMTILVPSKAMATCCLPGSTSWLSPGIHNFCKRLAVFLDLPSCFVGQGLGKDVRIVALIRIADDHVPKLADITCSDFNNLLSFESAGKNLLVSYFFRDIH